jgi:hypothetical protein
VDDGGDRRDERVAVERVHVTPRQAGRGLALPPLVPTVAVVFAFAGLAVGFRLGATAPAASPTTSAVAAGTTAAAPTALATDSTAYVSQPGGADIATYYTITICDSVAPTGIVCVPTPASSAEALPTGGLSLKEVLAKLDSGDVPTAAFERPISSKVVYARVVRLRQIDPYSDPDRANPWVWAVAIPGPTVSLESASTTTLDVEVSAAWIVLDYKTGALIETVGR